MSDILETVKIITVNGDVVINKSDYDAEIHTLVHDPDAPSFVQPDALAAKEAADALAAKEAADALAAKEAADAFAAKEAADAPKAVQKLVAKKGKSFIIVDAVGNQLVDTSFATEADAWNAALI